MLLMVMDSELISLPFSPYSYITHAVSGGISRSKNFIEQQENPVKAQTAAQNKYSRAIVPLLGLSSKEGARTGCVCMYLCSSLAPSLNCQHFFCHFFPIEHAKKSWQWRLGTRL